MEPKLRDRRAPLRERRGEAGGEPSAEGRDRANDARGDEVELRAEGMAGAGASGLADASRLMLTRGLGGLSAEAVAVAGGLLVVAGTSWGWAWEWEWEWWWLRRRVRRASSMAAARETEGGGVEAVRRGGLKGRAGCGGKCDVRAYTGRDRLLGADGECA